MVVNELVGLDYDACGLCLMRRVCLMMVGVMGHGFVDWSDGRWTVSDGFGGTRPWYLVHGTVRSRYLHFFFFFGEIDVIVSLIKLQRQVSNISKPHPSPIEY